MFCLSKPSVAGRKTPRSEGKDSAKGEKGEKGAKSKKGA